MSKTEHLKVVLEAAFQAQTQQHNSLPSSCMHVIPSANQICYVACVGHKAYVHGSKCVSCWAKGNKRHGAMLHLCQPSLLV